jgi:23S rRNA pseudouridine2605 synthase
VTVPQERLQKVLAAAGVGSRRACEQLILDGRVEVNGRVVRSLPILVEPGKDHVAIDHKRIRTERLVYFVLHKPRGVVCTNRDPAGRTRAVDCLVGVSERVFPVGRLDEDSTGLLLLTNDGELSERLAHPRYGVARTYLAETAGRVAPETIEKLKAGVWLAEGRTGRAQAKVVRRERERTVLEITLREGRNREVRRVLARLGHKVRRLKRIGLGPLRLGSLPYGAYRPLSPREAAALRAFADHSQVPAATRSRD